MKKLTLFFLLLSVVYRTQAQLYINGHIAPFDQETNTWLATITASQFGQDNQFTVSLEEGWTQLVIDGEAVDGQYTFQQITADSEYPASMTDANGNTLTGNIQFTFLPVFYLKGQFGYDYQDGTVTIANPEEDNDYLLSASIKWRGGTTNTDAKHKRNYNIKFAEDIKLFGMRNDNNWILDAGQPDVFRLRNRIAMDIWHDMNSKPYYAELEPKARNGVSGKIVEVFLNNEYRGIYNFSEKIDRKQMKLNKVGQNGDVHGVLYKGKSFNHTSMNDSIYKYDNYSNTLYGYEVKYPEVGDDNDSTDWKPLVDALNRNLILAYDSEQFKKEVADWFDIPVMIDYSIFLSSVNALDNSGKNMFWAVYDKDTDKRLTLAPWDLDCTFGQRWGGQLTEGSPSHHSPYYVTDVVLAPFYLLYQNNALQFNDRMNERYQSLRQPGNILSTDSLISRFTHYYQILKNSGAAKREENKWSGDTDVWGDEINFEKEYAYICEWIDEHMKVIDYLEFPVYYFNDKTTDIPIGCHKNNKNDYNIYTLSGQRVNHTSKLKSGIYIMNGKKIFIR